MVRLEFTLVFCLFHQTIFHLTIFRLNPVGHILIFILSSLFRTGSQVLDSVQVF